MTMSLIIMDVPTLPVTRIVVIKYTNVDTFNKT